MSIDPKVPVVRRSRPEDFMGTPEEERASMIQRIESLENQLFSLVGADRYMSYDKRSDFFADGRRGMVLAISMVPQTSAIGKALALFDALENHHVLDKLDYVQKLQNRENSRYRNIWAFVFALIVACGGAIAGAIATYFVNAPGVHK